MSCLLYKMVFCPTLKTESLFILVFLLEGFCHCYSLVYGFRIEAKKEWTCGWAVPGHDKAKSVLHRKASHSGWCKICCGVSRNNFLQLVNMAASGRQLSCPSGME